MIPSESSISVERWLARLPLPRAWAVAIIGLVLLCIPFLAAIADDALPVLVNDREGRYLFFAPLPVVAIYFLAILPSLERSRQQVAMALRPLVQLDDEAFSAVVAHACRRRTGLEALGFATGMAFALLLYGRPELHPLYPVSIAYADAGFIIIFAALGWCVAVVFEITRLTNDLLRQPIQVNILNIDPFESVGRQSLLLALVFLGGALLSLIFVLTPFELQDFLTWETILIYSILIALAGLAFFLGMYSTHRVLSTTKREQMARAQLRLLAAYDRLQLTAEQTPDAQAAAEFSAWTAAKQELRKARTWPYNTEMLRTLVVSGLVPLAIGLARVMAAWFAAP
jgi:hypothetical protein